MATVKPHEEKEPLDVVDGAGFDVDSSSTIITALVTEGEQ